MDARWPLALLSFALAAPVPGAEFTVDEVVELAAGSGERGPWRQNDSHYDYVDDPAVAIDERGTVSVAWVDQGRKDAFFRRLPDGKAVNFSRSPDTFTWLPRIALAPDTPDTVYALWQEIIFSGGSHGGEIFFARSEDGGTTFSEPVNLSNSKAGDGKGRITAQLWHNGSLDLVAGPRGELYVAWTEYEGRLWLRRSADGGRTFSEPAEVPGGHPARAPSLVLNSGGTVVLAWTNGAIHVARGEVPEKLGYADAPKLAFDPRGILHLVYAERNALFYAQSRDAGESFGPPRRISGNGLAFPHLGVDGNGRLYLVAERIPSARSRPRGLAIMISLDGGETFTEPRLIPHSTGIGPNGSFQGLLMQKLAVNARGEVAIVNSSLEDGESSRVWLMRGRLPP